VPPFRPKGRGISTLRSRHSLGNGTNKLVPLLSLRLGMKGFSGSGPSHASLAKRTSLAKGTYSYDAWNVGLVYGFIT
jgi:hypothetical protein